MTAFLNWFLGDVCLPVAVGAAIGLAVDWIRHRGWLLRILVESTLLMRHVRTYEKARSRTPGGSINPPDGEFPPPSGVTGPGVEARTLAKNAPPPVPPQTSVGAGDSLPLRSRTHRASTPQAPVGGGHAPATPPTGLPPSGDR